MRCVGKHVTDVPSEVESPIGKLIHWRTEMEAQLPRGSIMMLMHARNAVGAYQNKLAQGEWFRCPSCGGGGMWVDRGNHWFARCSRTCILLAADFTDPAEIALVRRIAPPPDWGRLYSRAELRLVPDLKVEGEA